MGTGAIEQSGNTPKWITPTVSMVSAAGQLFINIVYKIKKAADPC
jgi:hypothetical protein